MAATQETALQVNYKLPDGTLVNAYGKDQAHLESLLTAIADLATLITATAVQLGSFKTTAAANVANMTVQLNAQEVSADKQCKHGAMSLKTGTSAKGPWKGWLCAAPKGTPKDQQCEPIWVR